MYFLKRRQVIIIFVNVCVGALDDCSSVHLVTVATIVIMMQRSKKKFVKFIFYNCLPTYVCAVYRGIKKKTNSANVNIK
jgi:hypothetical protein